MTQQTSFTRAITLTRNVIRDVSSVEEKVRRLNEILTRDQPFMVLVPHRYRAADTGLTGWGYINARLREDLDRQRVLSMRRQARGDIANLQNQVTDLLARTILQRDILEEAVANILKIADILSDDPPEEVESDEPDAHWNLIGLGRREIDFGEDQ